MRVIVAHSNSFIPSKCKNQRPYQKAKCRSRNVRRQSVVARLRALQGVFAFLTVSTETAERSSRKNAGTVLAAAAYKFRLKQGMWTGKRAPLYVFCSHTTMESDINGREPRPPGFDLISDVLPFRRRMPKQTKSTTQSTTQAFTGAHMML